MLNAVHPVLSECQIVIIPVDSDLKYEPMTTSNGKQMMHVYGQITYKIAAADGSYIEANIPAESNDYADKATNKCMSFAYKYLCFQLFSIPLDGALDEGDSDHVQTGRPQQQKQKPQPSARDIRLKQLFEQCGYIEPKQKLERIAQVKPGIAWADLTDEDKDEIIADLDNQVASDPALQSIKNTQDR